MISPPSSHLVFNNFADYAGCTYAQVSQWCSEIREHMIQLLISPEGRTNPPQ